MLIKQFTKEVLKFQSHRRLKIWLDRAHDTKYIDLPDHNGVIQITTVPGGPVGGANIDDYIEICNYEH